MEWGFIEIILIIILLIHILNSMNIVSSRKLHTEQNTKSEETLISAFVESQNQLDSKITQINNRFDGLYSKVVTIDMIEEKFNYFKKEIDENKINE